jgi:sarcosine oxidase subunit gamma
MGIELPGPGFLARRGGEIYVWAGVGSWLVMSGDMGLEARLAGLAGAAVTDQSDGRAMFLVQGGSARRILSRLVPIDLDEAVFGADSTALTLAGHIPVQIWREDGKFALACFRSYAESLYHALVRAEKGVLANG